MIFNRRTLSTEKLKELESLISTSYFSNEREIKELQSKTVGLVKWNYKPTHSTPNQKLVHLDFYSPYRNHSLLKFIKENVLYNPNETIISIHTNTYFEESESPPHKDINSARTYLILLKQSEEGGILEIENQDVNFKVGEIIDYIGDTTLHSVTKIKKGDRKTFVLWCREKTSFI